MQHQSVQFYQYIDFVPRNRLQDFDFVSLDIEHKQINLFSSNCLVNSKKRNAMHMNFIFHGFFCVINNSAQSMILGKFYLFKK